MIKNHNIKGTNKLHQFKSLFDLYFDDIRNYIYYKSGDIKLSEDISQEVFLKLWENIDQVRNETVKSYLYTIASNLYNNIFNKKKVEFQFRNNINEIDSESPEFILELKEFDKILQNALSELPEKSRIAFLMNRIDKLTYKEIASRLNISVKAVEKRIHKALSLLKNVIVYKI